MRGTLHAWPGVQAGPTQVLADVQGMDLSLANKSFLKAKKDELKYNVVNATLSDRA